MPASRKGERKNGVHKFPNQLHEKGFFFSLMNCKLYVNCVELHIGIFLEARCLLCYRSSIDILLNYKHLSPSSCCKENV